MDAMFQEWVDIYEAMVDWPKRLEREGPFFRKLFEQVGVKRVLDTACGPGHHAAMFHRWGLEVEGADLSEGMIQRAIALHGQPTGLRWNIRAFQEPVPIAGYFDAAICIGNSLALAGNQEIVKEAVAQMFRAIRPGGVVVVQVLNLWALPEGPTHWQKCLRYPTENRDRIILKGVHRVGDKGYVDVVVAELSDFRSDETRPPTLTPYPSEQIDRIKSADSSSGIFPQQTTGNKEIKKSVPPSASTFPLRWEAQSEVFLGLRAEELASLAQSAQAETILFYGGYQQEPYTAQTSPDLIMVAWKGSRMDAENL